MNEYDKYSKFNDRKVLHYMWLIYLYCRKFNATKKKNTYVSLCSTVNNFEFALCACVCVCSRCVCF